MSPLFPHQMDWSKVTDELDRRCLELEQQVNTDWPHHSGFKMMLQLFSAMSVALKAGMAQ